MEIDIKAAMLSGLEEAIAQAVRAIWDNRDENASHALSEIVFRARAVNELIQRQFPENDAEIVSLPTKPASYSELMSTALAVTQKLAQFPEEEMYREMLRAATARLREECPDDPYIKRVADSVEKELSDGGNPP